MLFYLVESKIRFLGKISIKNNHGLKQYGHSYRFRQKKWRRDAWESKGVDSRVEWADPNDMIHLNSPKAENDVIINNNICFAMLNEIYF